VAIKFLDWAFFWYAPSKINYVQMSFFSRERMGISRSIDADEKTRKQV
jgi:hypothetical protein